MKKLAYVLILMFTMVSFTSCEKDNDPIDNPADGGLITLAQLDGTWNFQKYIYDGVEYTHDNALSGMSYIFVNQTYNSKMMIFNENDDVAFSYSKNLNYIKVWFGNDPKRYEFTVVGYDGVELRLKVDYVPTMWGYDYLGGVLVFKK